MKPQYREFKELIKHKRIDCNGLLDEIFTSYSEESFFVIKKIFIDGTKDPDNTWIIHEIGYTICVKKGLLYILLIAYLFEEKVLDEHRKYAEWLGFGQTLEQVKVFLFQTPNSPIIIQLKAALLQEVILRYGYVPSAKEEMIIFDWNMFVNSLYKKLPVSMHNFEKTYRCPSFYGTRFPRLDRISDLSDNPRVPLGKTSKTKIGLSKSKSEHMYEMILPIADEYMLNVAVYGKYTWEIDPVVLLNEVHKHLGTYPSIGWLKIEKISTSGLFRRLFSIGIHGGAGKKRLTSGQSRLHVWNIVGALVGKNFTTTSLSIIQKLVDQYDRYSFLCDDRKWFYSCGSDLGIIGLHKKTKEFSFVVITDCD